MSTHENQLVEALNAQLRATRDAEADALIASVLDEIATGDVKGPFAAKVLAHVRTMSARNRAAIRAHLTTDAARAELDAERVPAEPCAALFRRRDGSTATCTRDHAPGGHDGPCDEENAP